MEIAFFWKWEKGFSDFKWFHNWCVSNCWYDSKNRRKTLLHCTKTEIQYGKLPKLSNFFHSEFKFLYEKTIIILAIAANICHKNIFFWKYLYFTKITKNRFMVKTDYEIMNIIIWNIMRILYLIKRTGLTKYLSFQPVDFLSTKIFANFNIKIINTK